MPVLALRSGWSCIVGLRVNDMEGVMLHKGGLSLGGICVVSLRMNARVLSVLFESIGCGWE